MIFSVSPLLNLLAPKASAPVTSDSAAFDLMLAGAGEAVVGAAVGRQIAAPTGNPVPPADILSPMIGSPIPSADDELADAPPPAPTIPATLAAASPKPLVATPRPTAWPRFVKPETCAGPAGEPSISDAEAQEMETISLDPPMPVFEREATALVDPIIEPAEREQAASPNPQQSRDLPTPAAVTSAVAGTERSVRADTSIQNTPIARPVVDDPRSSLPRVPEPAPAPAIMPEPITPISVPVASGSPMPDPGTPAASVASGSLPASHLLDVRTSPVPTRVPRAGSPPLPLVTARASDARPIATPAADRVPEYEVARTLVTQPTLPASTDRPAPVLAAARTGSPLAQAAVVPLAPSPAQRPTDMAPLPLPAAPPRFAGSPFRPLPEIGAPAVQPIAPATVAAPVPATMGSANPVIGPAALLASSTTPIEPMPEATTSSFEPRPDAIKSPTPDRPSAAPMPMPSVASPPMIARAVTSGPARQVFAADLRRTGRDLRPVAGEALMTLGEAAGVGATAVPAPVTAPLDLRQDRWPFQMVDRIERLRDAVDAVDTRIRLIPDALGSIEVAVKRDGDIVHVHFTAEQAATRTLLQDAAPRLAEAAEARGLKLGQTAVGGDGSQPNGRQPQPQQPSAPAPARPRSAAAAVDEDATDTRIA
jgi:hypothetical protein